MGIECKGRRDELEQYVLGLLSSEEENELLVHADSCDKCSKELGKIRDAVERFKALSKSPPESFDNCAHKVGLEIEILKKQREKSRKIRHILKIAASLLFLASCLFAIFAGLIKSDKKGEIAWQIQNVGFASSDSQYPVIDENRIYALSGDGRNGRLIALDRDSGKTLWTSDFSVLRGAISAFHGNIFSASARGASISLLAIAGDSGKILWNMDLPPKNEQFPLFTPLEISASENSVCFARGNDIFLLDPKSGALKWKKESLSPHIFISRPQEYMGNIFVADTEHVYCLDSENGNLIWMKNSEIDAGDLMKPLMAISDGRIFLIRRARKGGARLLAMKVSDGETLWQKEAGGGIPYWIRAGQGFVFVKSKNLDFYDEKSGDFCRSEKIGGCAPLTFGKDEIFMVEGKDSGRIISINLKSGKTDDFFRIGDGSCAGLAIASGKAFVSANDGSMYAISIRYSFSDK